MTGRRELRARKPASGKFVAAISHVLSAEHAEKMLSEIAKVSAHFNFESLGANQVNDAVELGAAPVRN